MVHGGIAESRLSKVDFLNGLIFWESFGYCVIHDLGASIHCIIGSVSRPTGWEIQKYTTCTGNCINLHVGETTPSCMRSFDRICNGMTRFRYRYITVFKSQSIPIKLMKIYKMGQAKKFIFRWDFSLISFQPKSYNIMITIFINRKLYRPFNPG